MPRLIILILPLSILWMVLVSGPSKTVGSDGRMVSKESVEFPEALESVKRSLRSGGNLGHDRLNKFKASPFGAGVEGPVGENRSGEDRSSKEAATLVWEAIQEKIPVHFSEKEKQDLRGYIDELAKSNEEQKKWMCWAPGVSEDKALIYHEVEKFTGLNHNQVGVMANQFLGSGRWGDVASHSGSVTDQGKPVVLTWSVVPDGTMTPGLSGQSDEESDLQVFLAGIYGSNPGEPVEEQPWFPVLEASFDDMGATCGVNFVYEPNDDGLVISSVVDGELGVRGDIRLAARALDGANSTLGFAFSPGYGDFVIDSSDTFFNSTASSSIRLHNVVTHELGHAMGLAHVCPVNGTKLLEPLITLSFRGPRFDEFQSLQRQYGDPLENHSEERDNDLTADATPLTLLVDDTLSFPRLSIDDNSDVDFFRLPALAGQKISVEIEPSLGAYLEGEQVGDNCTGGVLFDPGNIHDLTLDLFAPGGGALLASSTSGGLGDGESIVSFEIPDNGDYHLRINGGSSNATQIYSLDIFTEDRPPSPEFSIVSTAIIAESGKVKNFRPDPNETLKVEVELKNIGNLATENLQVDLTGPLNLTLFETIVPSLVLSPDGSVTVELIFGLQGSCGAPISLNMTVSDPGVVSQDFELSYLLGEVLSEVLVDEGFDASTSLPPDWGNSSTGEGFSWVVLPSANTTSAPNAMFCQGVGGVGQSILTSPVVTLGGLGGVLRFRHLYDTELNWDGCVLEASRNGGAWFDLPDSAAEVISGAYNSTMRAASTSGLANRGAWTGESSGFITTEIRLPSSWSGDELRFRWIIACDRSFASEGWYLDDVELETSTASCETHEPELVLSSGSNDVSEGELVEVSVSSVLPLVLEEPFALTLSGEASPEDLEGVLTGSIAAGSDVETISLLVVEDGLVENEESLVLTLTGEGESELFTLRDPGGFTSWAAGYGIPGDEPEADLDGDGFSALAEYLLDTDPTDRSSLSGMEVELDDEVTLFPLGDLPLRSDATIGAERSTDLLVWNPAPVTRTESGLEIARVGEKSFLRLTFSLNE